MELSIQTRTIFGKKVKTLRRGGLIPAEIFGHGFPNRHVSVPSKDFSKIFKEVGEHTIINLIAEGEKIPALVSDVQYEPLRGETLSIDFRQVRMDEKIQTKVPIEFSGEAPTVKLGFVVVHVLKEIEIEALPAKIPHRIEVDLSSLEIIGQSIRVSDIKVPAGAKILTPPETVIATVSEMAKEEIKETPPPAPEAEAPQSELQSQTEAKTETS